LNSQLNYVVTETDISNPEVISGSETLGDGKMIELQTVLYDSAFWEDYTIILPDEDFTVIAEDIIRKNAANNDKQAIMDVIYKYPKNKAARIDSVLSYYHRKGKFTGNALVEFGDGQLFSKSYNNEITHHNERTQFRIGSVSKTFTATLILMLEKDGLLSTEDPVSKFLPGYQHGEVTISQLLSHTSGIPDYLNEGQHLDRLLTDQFMPEALITKFCSEPLEFPSGERFDYSNSGYVILAGIIEKVTGQSYRNILRDKILIPLQMNDSYFGAPENKENLAIGYLYGAEEPSYPIGNTIGAGGITSTTADLLKWSKSFEENQLLTEVEKKKLWTPQAHYTDWEADYAYGWMIDRTIFDVSKKHRVIYHPGTDNGFNSMFLKQPDKGISIILLNNTGSFPRFDIADLILRELAR
ncbi:MAG: serine hydrolase domain-containing protein, partial [Cyclobacteriaceae bacterium]